MRTPLRTGGVGRWLVVVAVLCARRISSARAADVRGGAAVVVDPLLRGPPAAAADAANAAANGAANAWADPLDSDTFLVVGIKTRVVQNVHFRDVIRATWAAAARRLGVRVVFLGGDADLSSYVDATERKRREDAISREKQTHGDLLTAEIACVDSYATLLDKVVGFFHWVVSTLRPQAPALQFAMVVDDDVFLRLDRLVALLHSDAAPATRFYGGSVYEALTPMRDATHKNYIAWTEYPLRALLPFVGGPHYVLSLDVVAFISRNRDFLRGLRGLDDVSVALWLRAALQIQPTHLSQFVLLRREDCRDDAIAIADLSPPAIRHLHENAVGNRSLCLGLGPTAAAPSHRAIVLPDGSASAATAEDASDRRTARLSWEIQFDPASRGVQIRVRVRVDVQEVDYVFVPSAERPQRGLCDAAAQLLRDTLYTIVDDAFCAYHRRALLAFLTQAGRSDRPLGPLLALARHNLAVGLLSSPEETLVGLSAAAVYARVLVECLLVQMYPRHRVVVVPEHALGSRTPNVVVFSILDIGESLRPQQAATPTGSAYVERYSSSATQLIMLSGEAWPVHRLDARVVLVSTVSARQHARQLYLPVASTAFAETAKHSPLALLDAQRPLPTDSDSRRFCAYLYARCDRLKREFMFDLLNDVAPVDALGACQGTKAPAVARRRAQRYGNAFYTDAAVALYRDYKFVIAFENSLDVEGYVTEKIVTAFLAGAVPVYLGHSRSVRRLFNARAFIDCGAFESLRECAHAVRRVHEAPALYEQMRREKPVVDARAFFEAFSWHRDVVEWASQLQPSERLDGAVSASERLHQLIESGDRE